MVNITFSDIKLVLKGLMFFFLIYTFFKFLCELWFQQALLDGIWVSLSFQQKALENVNLGLMDLKLMITALCLIFFAKFWGKRE